MGSSGPYANTSVSLTVRYAPYLEDFHSTFLALTHDKSIAAIAVSPYSTWADTWSDFSYAFFYVGYSISDYPALYDMFGKHMSGLDIETFHRDNFSDLLSKSEVSKAISEKMKSVDEDLVEGILGKFQIAARDINSVMTSSFVIGKAAIENGRVKKLSQISSATKFDLLFNPQVKSNAFLNWSKNIAATYASVMKLYYATSMTVTEANYKFKTYNTLWPFIALDFERAALSALRGKLSSYRKLERRQRSAVSKGLLIGSYAVTGLALGASIGSWIGAVVGAVVGAILGLAMVLLE